MGCKRPTFAGRAAGPRHRQRQITIEPPEIHLKFKHPDIKASVYQFVRVQANGEWHIVAYCGILWHMKVWSGMVRYGSMGGIFDIFAAKWQVAASWWGKR